MEEKLENEKSASELEALEEENRRLRAENERLQQLSFKERIYDRIHVSVRTMDFIIAALCVLFVAVVVMGMVK